MKAIKFLLLTSLIFTVACTRKSKSKSSNDGIVIEAPAIEIEDPQDSVEDIVGENNDEDDQDSGDTTSQFTPVSVAAQNFESLNISGNWSLIDFGTFDSKDQYVSESNLLFNVQWTSRTRKLLADRLGYERKEMTKELANSLCPPKLEVGKEFAYVGGDSQNMIAELDTDLKHCGVSGDEPAAVNLSSFVPTKIGYKYKIKVSYQMRKYSQMTDKSYRNLVVRFGSALEKFDTVFDEFKTVELDMIATHKFSKLMLRDNGLPNTFGILIDNVEVINHGPVDNYNTCQENFRLNSRGFKKCVIGEVDTDLECAFDETAKIKASKAASVATNRRVYSNIFIQESAQSGNINFFSLGLKGKLSLSCQLDGQAGLMDIEGKTLSFNEISWNNVTVDNYPEVARVRIRLQNCYEEDLNRTITIGTVKTSETFSYFFEEDEDGRSYIGCKMDKLIIKDITPQGPSADGFDINSLKIE